jgi:diguanylate cyclase (GGDEF)-like protein
MEALRTVLDMVQTPALLGSLAYAVIRLEPTRAALDKALQALNEAVAVLDREGEIVYTNPAASDLGLQQGESFAADLRGAGVPETEVARLVAQQARPAAPPLTETLHLGDPERLVQVTLTPVTENGGQVLGTLLLGRDVTELERRNTLLEEERVQLDAAVRQLGYLAQHDPLTGLPNRRSLSEALERVVAHARRGTESVLFFLDLDNFKLVNDTLGHAAGDQLLTTIGQMLAEKLRDGDLLVRLGGDEFAILLEDTKLDQALVVAERIRATIEMFRFVRDGRSFELGLSIGVVQVDGKFNAQVVLTQADIAMYTAKERGRNQVALYQPSNDAFTQLTEAHQWVPRIKDALASDRFVLHFQPVVRLSDGHTAHHEVLLRMIGPTGELIYPNTFLPAAERFGLMPALDHWMIAQTIRTLQTHPHGHFFVNLSGHSLGNDALIPFIEAALRRSGVAPNRLGFEITETAVSQDATRIEDWIRQVKALGCRFALGDFGTGGTSFANLRNLRVDQIKIDGSFIRSLDSDPRSRDIVQAMHLLAQSFGKETVAEFIETDANRGIVAEMGVTYGQGFALGKPGPQVAQASAGRTSPTWSTAGPPRDRHP